MTATSIERNPRWSGPIRGADAMIRSLELAGVDTIFAYPGGASMELHQSLLNSPIRVILPRHEQGGAFAAAGYARATGKTGTCMATSGPGATNLVTSIADAFMDSVPLVAITGQVPQQFIGKNAFQETDIIGITRPVVKHSYLVLNADDIPAVVAEAYYIANSGRPGPVVIDLPKDVQQAMCNRSFPEQVNMRAYQPKLNASDLEVAAIRDAISKSERPCLYVGGGIILSNAATELRQFAESYNIPVVTSLMGVGAFPETHPLALEWLGMHGTYYGNYAANESDLLLCIGARFDDRVTGGVDTFARHATIVHVDVDPSEINKNKRADIGIICDARDILSKLLPNPIFKEYSQWHAQLNQWKQAYPLRYPPSEKIQPQYVVEKLYEKTAGQAIVVTGVGQHQMFAAQFYKFERPRQLLTSGGLGTMGFGIPSAIGAQIGCPDRQVLMIDGDGSFQMNIQELGTIHCESLPIKMVILNNQHLGMVAQWEDRFYERRRGHTELQSAHTERPYPHFVKIAEGYLIPGREVWEKADLPAAIDEMLASNGPFVLDVHIHYQDHVLPMIPAGGSHLDIMVD